MVDLSTIAKEIRDIITEYQKKNSLSFIEDTHTYFIKGKDGNITSDMPSVSTVLKAFYTPFNAEGTKAFQNCNGNKEEERLLLEKWQATADYATNMGSRVHFILEHELIKMYGAYKEVRKPIFECDEEQTISGDAMIKAGIEFIDLMHKRGAVLLDTEVIMGNLDLGYFGQPDKTWLMIGKNGKPGIVITDWKSNKESNMSDEVMPWTIPMLSPFGHLNDNALSHYKLQLPLYGRLLLKMLEGTKYENIDFLGCVIVHLTKSGEFREFRVDKGIIDTVFSMDLKEPLSRLSNKTIL